MAFVELEVKEHVGVLTINRPEALNALNDEVIRQLDQVLDSLDLSVLRCLIVTGAGQKAFVAGADIAQMSGLTKAEGEAFGKLGNDVFRKLETLPIPTIAAVNGFALGGGCELSMACDIRLASDAAVFGQPEVGLGITPGFGGTQRMARLIGMGKAKELIYTARNIKAPEALSIGLVQAVYPAEELMAETRRIAEPENDGTAEFLAYAACLLAQKANAKSIVAHSLSGTSARLLSARRPVQTIHALTPDVTSLKALNFSWGVLPHQVGNDDVGHLARAERFIASSSLFGLGEDVVITAGQPTSSSPQPRGTNLVKIYRK